MKSNCHATATTRVIEQDCRLGMFPRIVAWAGPAVAAKIACVGDSITWGWALSDRDHQSYHAVRQTLLGSQHIVKNCGTSGCAMLKQGDKPHWNDANFIASAGKDSEASDAIIRIVDKPDPRPVWIGVWGDCSDAAQAIWKVQNTRSDAELQTFLSRIRIRQIAHQDDTIDWLLENFPNLFIIYSKTTYQGMFGGSDPISDLAWVNANIRQNHGPLGAVYPPAGMGCSGVCEGDSPSFLHLVSAVRGLNNAEDPTQESWGGQFKRDGTADHYVDGPGRSTISKWHPQYQADFALRADWMLP